MCGGVEISGKQIEHELNYRKDQFIFVGRLEELKGIDMLLRVWQRLGNQFSKLIICGTGELEHWCREFVSREQIKNVEFRGTVSNRDVKKIIRESRALVLPTRWYEGFPVSIVEAYSLGTPVVGPNIGNVNSLIRQGITGFTFEYSDEFSLQETVIETVKQKWNEIKIKKFCKEYFGEERNYKVLKRIYKRLN